MYHKIKLFSIVECQRKRADRSLGESRDWPSTSGISPASHFVFLLSCSSLELTLLLLITAIFVSVTDCQGVMVL